MTFYCFYADLQLLPTEFKDQSVGCQSMEVEDESVVVEQTTSAPLKTVVSFYYISYLLKVWTGFTKETRQCYEMMWGLF